MRGKKSTHFKPNFLCKKVNNLVEISNRHKASKKFKILEKILPKTMTQKKTGQPSENRFFLFTFDKKIQAVHSGGGNKAQNCNEATRKSKAEYISAKFVLNWGFTSVRHPLLSLRVPLIERIICVSMYQAIKIHFCQWLILGVGSCRNAD